MCYDINNTKVYLRLAYKNFNNLNKALNELIENLHITTSKTFLVRKTERIVEKKYRKKVSEYVICKN